MPPLERWVGLFVHRLRGWQLSCRLFPCKVIPQICGPVARPPVCVSPVASVTPTRIRPFCVILTRLCVLGVVVLLHVVKSFLPFFAVVFTLSFAVHAFALACVLLAFAFARAALAFAFVVRVGPSTCLILLSVLSFLSTISQHVSVNSTQ